MTVLFRCRGCGATISNLASPFRCSAAGGPGDIDHVVARVPDAEAEIGPDGHEANPFLRFRRRLSARVLALSHGIADEAFCEMVERLDRAVQAVDGRGFVETPLASPIALAGRLGLARPDALLVKDETGNVSGSHKARHLAGVMLYLLVAERAGLLPERRRLAIASCGNAALAAAIVARAADWPLEVFVPPSADRSVLDRLADLGACVHTCDRQAGTAGDPCYLAFRDATARGAVPFCCQGSDNGLTIEGGETLAWEILGRLAPFFDPHVAVPDRFEPPDRVFVQVGGGALASAVAQGFQEVRRSGGRPPRLYAVQTAGGYPLARAYDRLVARMLASWPEHDLPPSGSPGELAAAIAAQPDRIAAAMAFARTHRSAFMWPWEEEPRSIAHGILDDETYDWATVVEGMLLSGGHPVVVGEERLRAANAAARDTTGIDVDHTGSAGLAGLMELLDLEPALAGARALVIFSGVRRG